MNYLDALHYGNKILKLSKIKNYNLDTEILLSKVLNLKREILLINLQNPIDKKNFNSFKKLVLRRGKYEPIAYILRKKEFWKNTFKIKRGVLIPRPETEIIVNEVLKLTCSKSSKNFLDIGTGSGCILLSIIKERPYSYGTAIDISKKAINIAISNAKMHHLENKIKFINIDIDKYIHSKYDFIICNPPYINNIELKRLDENVRLYEPHLALKAGNDGFDFIRKLIFKSKILLKKNGTLVFEIGEKQEEKSKYLLNNNGFYINKICKDINLSPRVIISTKTF